MVESASSQFHSQIYPVPCWNDPQKNPTGCEKNLLTHNSPFFILNLPEGDFLSIQLFNSKDIRKWTEAL